MEKKEELIVVFKKNISEKIAEAFLQSLGIPFREGMDSSKGKIYFYATGGKYILTFQHEQDKASFRMKRYQFLPEIHEIYEPNWEIQKD